MESPSKASGSSPCWKKKEPDAGFLANVKDHLDQFVSTSKDQHRICLKKTMRGVGDFVRLKKQGKVRGIHNKSDLNLHVDFVPRSVDFDSFGCRHFSRLLPFRRRRRRHQTSVLVQKKRRNRINNSAEGCFSDQIECIIERKSYKFSSDNELY